MSWANKLLETYDICKSKVGEGNVDQMLLPLSHLTVKAQIEVVLDEVGSFITAFLVENEEATTVIPVTEDSASRCSGITAHPLHDKLIYIAKDYPVFSEKDNKEQWRAHQHLLKNWVDSIYTHPTIQAIYQYLEKGTLLQDLVSADILKLEDNLLDKKTKFQKLVSQADAFVRFKVIGNTEPWCDKKLFDTYHKFYMSYHTETDLCYVTGNKMYCTDKHPAKLRQGKDKAKLISTNDSTGFTFRGRFVSKKEAISVGYETSQKIHNTLRWLIEKQAYTKDGQTILTWNAHCNNVLSPMSYGYEDFFESERKIDTEETYAKRVNKAIAGYRQDITNPNEDIVIMAMDAATIGRFSITYYQEIKESSYYSNLQKWFTYCSWPQYSNSKYMNWIGTPIPRDIISCAYGTLRNGFITVDEKLMTLHSCRLLPCISEGKNIPYDFISGLNKQAKIMSLTNKYNWHKVIGILCAVFKKYCYDTEGKEWSVSVLENKIRGNTNIDYQLGRLLAMYDGIEQYALNILNEDRPTNAMRLYAYFQENPYRTWSILDKKLVPYVTKLGNKCEYLRKMKQDISDEIMLMLKEDNIKLEDLQNLSPYFVLGFDCQRNEIKRENIKRHEENKQKEEK